MLPLPRPSLLGPALLSLAVLAGCASPRDTISLIPDRTDAVTSQDGVFTQPLVWSRTQPGCSGECPRLDVKSLVFPGHGKLTALVEEALVTMTGLASTGLPPYQDLDGLEAYFWRTAGPRDQIMLSARTRYRNQHLTTLELDSWQYVTGAAHGVSATQFLMWDNQRDQPLTLDDILRPGQRGAYEQVLRDAHARWRMQQPDAQHDPQTWDRLWPFQPSDNAALTDQGLVVKYDTYQLAPYSYGQPELLLPYAQLRDILQPAFLP